MRKVDLESLKNGTITDCDYVSGDGELLVSKGATISDSLLQALKRRHIDTIYAKEEDEEIKRLLSHEFEQLDELKFDENDPLFDAPVANAKSWLNSPKPKALLLPEFKDIKQGKEGLMQLLQSKRADDLDNEIKEGRVPETPVGPSLKSNITELMPADRTEGYKSQIKQSYQGALADTTRSMSSLADGTKIDGAVFRTAVDGFVTLFATDRNLMLNLVSVKVPAGEDFLYSHSFNVMVLSIAIATALGYSRSQIVEIGIGALLHDAGMLLLPKEIRLKKGKLDSSEWFEIQKHPILGLHLLEKIVHLPHIVSFMAYQCHERENGKGYPKQRSSRFVHRFAKIIQVADIYEALSSPRPYRPAYMPYTAMEMLIKMTRQGLVPGDVIKALLEYLSIFPVGSIVELSDQRIGKVIKANATSFAKAVVSIIGIDKNTPLPKEKMYVEDLAKNTTVQIVKAYDFTTIKSCDLMDGF